MGPVAAGGDSKRREKPGIIDVNSILGVRVARVDVEAKLPTINLNGAVVITCHGGFEEHDRVPPVSMKVIQTGTHFFRAGNRAVNGLAQPP